MRIKSLMIGNLCSPNDKLSKNGAIFQNNLQLVERRQAIVFRILRLVPHLFVRALR